MCQANGKLLGHYLEIKRTKKFLETLAPVIGITITALVVVRQGGSPAEQGTWGHPRVAVNLAMWCSTEFEVVMGWVEDWMRGSAPRFPHGAGRIYANSH